MHVKKSDKIRIDIQFKDGSKSDLTFTHDGTPLTDSNQDGIEITFANDIATLTIANAEPKHSGNYFFQILCRKLYEQNTSSIWLRNLKIGGQKFVTFWLKD